jgi:hypothetical protein
VTDLQLVGRLPGGVAAHVSGGDVAPLRVAEASFADG